MKKLRTFEEYFTYRNPTRMPDNKWYFQFAQDDVLSNHKKGDWGYINATDQESAIAQLAQLNSENNNIYDEASLTNINPTAYLPKSV